MVMDFRTWLTVISFVVVAGGSVLYIGFKVQDSTWWLFLSPEKRRDFVFAVVVIPTAILLVILLLTGWKG